LDDGSPRPSHVGLQLLTSARIITNYGSSRPPRYNFQKLSSSNFREKRKKQKKKNLIIPSDEMQE
jgi:hypothetical protein